MLPGIATSMLQTTNQKSPTAILSDILNGIYESSFFFFFWKGSTFSNAGSDGTQPVSCVNIQNRQSTYSCGCPMYGTCQNDAFCGLFCSATLAIRCRSKAPFVHERLKTPNTSLQAVEPDP